MYNTAKKQVWYGELRTARGNAIVVHDNQLPEASPGRIYLFNSQRNAIIEYVEDIVKPNLHDLGEDEAKAAEREFGSAFKAVRSEFMQKQQARVNLNNVKDSAPARKPKPEPEVEVEVEADNMGDDFDDDWDDSFDD